MPQRNRTAPDTSARRIFGRRLNECRSAEGFSLEDLSRRVQVSKSHLHRVETAQYMPPPELPPVLDDLFTTDGIFRDLYTLARHEIHPDKYRRRMALEEQAVTIAEFAGMLVPGLLQTEPYARALFRATNPRAGKDRIDELVTARMGRKALLSATPAPDLSVVLDEAVLQRSVGGKATMREQLLELAGAADGPTTTIQLLPFSHGEHGLMGGSLALWTMEDGPAVAYEESIDSGTLLEEHNNVLVRRQAYDRARAHAMSPRSTAELLRERAEDY